MNSLDKNKLEYQYATLMQQKLALMLKKQAVPNWLNERIKQLAKVLGLDARYGVSNPSNFLYEVDKVLKYTIPKDFQAALEHDPTDPTTRLVYADALQEAGDHEEAEFQRNLGEWLWNGHHKTDGHELPHHIQLAPYHEQTPLPKGVKFEMMPYLNMVSNSIHNTIGEDYGAMRSDFEDSDLSGHNANVPHFYYTPEEGYIQHFRWKNFADMEKAFRNAFKAEKRRLERLSKPN